MEDFVRWNDGEIVCGKIRALVWVAPGSKDRVRHGHVHSRFLYRLTNKPALMRKPAALLKM
nr:MAG TPA: hypothetical protein [Caudoviricetes sp.]